MDEQRVETHTMKPPLENDVRGIRRLIYWVLAGFFFALAVLGVALPGVPTTPFLLLMCYFLIRVSPALHDRALAWPIFGAPLRDWREQGGVRPHVKLLACAMVTLLVGSTLIFSGLHSGLKTIILVLAATGVTVVLRLPTAQTQQN